MEENEANEGKPSVCFDELDGLVGEETGVVGETPFFLVKSLPKIFFFGVEVDDDVEVAVVGVTGVDDKGLFVSDRTLALELDGRKCWLTFWEVCSPWLPPFALLKV